MTHTPFLVEGLQAVTISQQGTDSFPDTLPAHSLAPFVKKVVRNEVWAPLCFHILKIQTQSAKMGDYICQRTVLMLVLSKHAVAMCTSTLPLRDNVLLSEATCNIMTEKKLFTCNSSSAVPAQCSNKAQNINLLGSIRPSLLDALSGPHIVIILCQQVNHFLMGWA